MLIKSKSIFTKFLFAFAILMTSLVTANAAVNVVDVEIFENAFEVVDYNPLNAGSGDFFDSGENQSVYTLTGTVFVENNHPTESIHDVTLNLSNVSNILSISYTSGSAGSVLEQNSNFVVLQVGDLGPGQNTTFSYTVNSSAVAPPLNHTSNYSASRVLAGLPFSVTDTVHNSMDSAIYSETCIYNITVNQTSLGFTNSDNSVQNFTFDNNTAIAGTDAANAAFLDNRNLTWNVSDLGCLNAGASQNIGYTVNTPLDAENASSYDAINSTINYWVNTSISTIFLENLTAVGDVEILFDKQLIEIFQADNGTWNVTGEASSLNTMTVNLTQVSLFVSVRNGTGTGFTNPSVLDNDTISGATLLQTYNPGQLLNSTNPTWNNSASPWLFNSTFQTASPIVWMDVQNHLHDDGVQLSNRSISYGNSNIYVKEIYVAVGYWIEITKNISRLAEGNYSINITVQNRGTTSTPTSQSVIVYNFIPIEFNLSSPFVYSSSVWYNSTDTNTTLTDATYNGTMFQHALIPNGNPNNSSLAAYNGTYNSNNTWVAVFNVSGSGEFNFEELFLTGVDPLQVDEYGATPALQGESPYEVLSGLGEYVLAGLAGVMGLLILLA